MNLVIAGPCAIEHSGQWVVDVCGALREHGPLIFKASYDKANRSRYDSPRGVGFHEGMRSFEAVKAAFPDQKILTDIHDVGDVIRISPYVEEGIVDCLQTPAFLGRQQDLLAAVGAVPGQHNYKIPQFQGRASYMDLWQSLVGQGWISPWMTYRGRGDQTDLKVDLLDLIALVGTDALLDVTHTRSDVWGTEEPIQMARVAGTLGFGVYCEVHPNPKAAISDANKQLDFHTYKRLREAYADSC